MAGLSVLLETTTAHEQAQHASSTRTARVISKTTLLNTTTSSSSSLPPMAMAAATTSTSSFLQRCFLCRRELADGKDIYIYRGDRAFCSDECRCRHILMEEDGAINCSKDAAPGRSRRRQAVAGGFAY